MHHTGIYIVFLGLSPDLLSIIGVEAHSSIMKLILQIEMSSRREWGERLRTQEAKETVRLCNLGAGAGRKET